MSYGVEHGQGLRRSPYGGSQTESDVYSENPPVFSAYLFITGASSSQGTISNKTYLANTVPANKVLTSFESDSDSIDITVEIHAQTNSWAPGSVTVYAPGATPVTVAHQNWTQVGSSSRVWTAQVTLTDAATSGGIMAVLSSGDRASCGYVRSANPPIVTSPQWGKDGTPFSVGEYPTSPDTGLQTAVKSGDTVDIQFTLDSSATKIRVESFGASSSTQDFSGSYSAGTNVITGVVVGSSSGTKQFKLKANRSGGTYGASATTQDITLDQNSHSYGGFTNQVFTPADNFALKSGDSMTGDLTISNWVSGDYISYTSSEVTITNSGTYAVTKTYTYLSGSYRDSGTNVTITSRRKANGKQSSTNYLVKIANVSPVLSVLGATSRLMSRATGGDKTYTITLSSDQELKATPTLARDTGPPADDGLALPGLSGSAPDKTWTATMTIRETDTKNTGATSYTWTGINGTNGAGLSTTTITTNPTYTVGGFEQRRLTLAAYDEFDPIGTMVTNKDNANKVNVEFATGSGVYVHNWDNTTKYPTSRKFTIVDSSGNFLATGTYLRCLDSDIYDAGTSYWMDIEEVA